MSILTKNELKSAVWTKLSAHLKNRLTSLHKELENDLVQDDTNKVRGRIAEIRKLLAIEKEPPVIRKSKPDYS